MGPGRDRRDGGRGLGTIAPRLRWPVEAFLGDGRLGPILQRLENGRSGPGRLATVGTLVPDLLAAAHGIEKTNVNDGFQIQHAADFYERLYPILDVPAGRRIAEQPMDVPVALALSGDTCAIGSGCDERPIPGLGSTGFAGTSGAGGRPWNEMPAGNALEEPQPDCRGPIRRASRAAPRARGRAGRRAPGWDQPPVDLHEAVVMHARSRSVPTIGTASRSRRPSGSVTTRTSRRSA